MKTLQLPLLSLLLLSCCRYGESYSKYGRTCKDIGCPSTEQCVMAETPCSYYSRENECGMYPTCQKLSSNSAPSCASYICPPTKRCMVDGGEPKCVDDDQANIPGNQNGNKVYQTYNTHNTNDQPSAAAQPNPNPGYPALPGQTTTRSPNRRPGYGEGGGYQGGNVGSGYPGQGGGYQGGNVGSGYPGQSGGYQGGQAGSGYPGQSGGGYQGNSGGGSRYPGYQGGNIGSGYPGGYPQQGRPQQGYPQQGYPQQGYPQQGYQGYRPGQQQGYGSYNNYNNQQRPAQNSGSNPIYDTLKNTLSTYGTNLLKNALGGLKL